MRLRSGWLLLVAALVVSFPAPAVVHAADELEQDRTRLLQMMQAGDYPEAIELGQVLREQAPFDSVVLLLLGEALLEQAETVGVEGNLDPALLEEAEAILARAARLRPDSMDTWKLLGYARFHQEDAPGAAEAMREAARVHPPAFLASRDGSLTFLFFAEMDAAPRGGFMVLALLVVLGSVILHELAHAGSATLLGDPTSGALGRLTFNPLSHVDPFGTVVLPLLLVATQAGIVFGYARPVPFWPENFRHPRFYRVLTALAGPGSNVLVLLACAGLGRLMVPWLILHDLPLWPAHLLFLAGMINALLAVLNALPIFPLDGGHLIATFLPASWGPRAERRLAMFGIVLIILVIQTGAWDGLIEGLQVGMSLAFGL